MSAPSLWNEWLDRDHFLRVVEDEQPALVLTEPGADDAGRLVQVGRLRRDDAERAAEGNVVGQAGGRVVCADPPDEGVGVGVAVGVLDGQAGFPDAAEAVDGLDEGGELTGLQGCSEVMQQLVAAREVWVAGVRDVPDLAGALRRCAARRRGAAWRRRA